MNLVLGVFAVLAATWQVGLADEANVFRVTPYVQRPAKDAITLLWLTQTAGDASVSWWIPGAATTNTIASATQIAPTDREANSRFTAENVIQYCQAPEFGYDKSVEAGDNYPSYTREGVSAGWSMPYTVPYQYRVRLTGLQPGTTYGYRVTLAGGASYEKVFRTAPAGWTNMRFVYYSDSETEPKDNPISTGRTTDWTDPLTGKERTYYATQTEAYASNVASVVRFRPDFIVMAGDLAQKGSRQLDWDEFWRHNAGPLNDPAGSIPIVASPGNHDYWSYNDGGECGLAKYTSYFEFATNGTEVVGNEQERFHRVDYGPVTFLFMDANNGDDSDQTKDTNFAMSRTAQYPGSASSNCRAPDFNVGSVQYRWLEAQLKDAQTNSVFIFVVSHQCPYSVGDHGRPPGTASGHDTLSGQPLRVLEPLFHKYGVAAWLCGHDEMMERSSVNGTETLPDGTTRPHTLQVWDMGIAGDGLRGWERLVNSQERYRASKNAPEVYDANGVLVAGGKHYGHMEVSVSQRADGTWQAVFDPVYEFFTTNSTGRAVYGGTRHYDDRLTLVNRDHAHPGTNKGFSLILALGNQKFLRPTH